MNFYLQRAATAKKEQAVQRDTRSVNIIRQLNSRLEAERGSHIDELTTTSSACICSHPFHSLDALCEDEEAECIILPDKIVCPSCRGLSTICEEEAIRSLIRNSCAPPPLDAHPNQNWRLHLQELESAVSDARSNNTPVSAARLERAINNAQAHCGKATSCDSLVLSPHVPSNSLIVLTTEYILSGWGASDAELHAKGAQVVPAHQREFLMTLSDLLRGVVDRTPLLHTRVFISHAVLNELDALTKELKCVAGFCENALNIPSQKKEDRDKLPASLLVASLRKLGVHGADVDNQRRSDISVAKRILLRCRSLFFYIVSFREALKAAHVASKRHSSGGDLLASLEPLTAAFTKNKSKVGDDEKEGDADQNDESSNEGTYSTSSSTSSDEGDDIGGTWWKVGSGVQITSPDTTDQSLADRWGSKKKKEDAKLHEVQRRQEMGGHFKLNSHQKQLVTTLLAHMSMNPYLRMKADEGGAIIKEREAALFALQYDPGTSDYVSSLRNTLGFSSGVLSNNEALMIQQSSDLTQSIKETQSAALCHLLSLSRQEGDKQRVGEMLCREAKMAALLHHIKRPWRAPRTSIPNKPPVPQLSERDAEALSRSATSERSFENLVDILVAYRRIYFTNIAQGALLRQQQQQPASKLKSPFSCIETAQPVYFPHSKRTAEMLTKVNQLAFLSKARESQEKTFPLNLQWPTPSREFAPVIYILTGQRELSSAPLPGYSPDLSNASSKPPPFVPCLLEKLLLGNSAFVDVHTKYANTLEFLQQTSYCNRMHPSGPSHDENIETCHFASPFEEAQNISGWERGLRQSEGGDALLHKVRANPVALAAQLSQIRRHTGRTSLGRMNIALSHSPPLPIILITANVTSLKQQTAPRMQARSTLEFCSEPQWRSALQSAEQYEWDILHNWGLGRGKLA